ncbi:MAG: MBL fold metallo-hydrolase [Spirochaetia bacterium]|nr:MBL fold metallo-hydrolase [Spirochaetia bacterium]
MKIRITTLVENSLGEHLALKNEHGLSFYIEAGSHKILFDTGQSDSFMYNAEQLKIDLSNLDYVVLSHGHYDHSGGLVPLCEVTRGFRVDIPEAVSLQLRNTGLAETHMSIWVIGLMNPFSRKRGSPINL